MTDRIPLVYILSSGRSGSTLLELLLGAHSNAWPIGEFDVLPWELQHRRVPCGCGTPIEHCDFWAPILDNLSTDTTGYHIGYFRDFEHTRKILRWNLLANIMRGKVSERFERGVNEYGRNNERFLSAVHDAAQERTGEPIDWIIDASKDPYRLFWLQASNRFDIRVIHLVKDPRAFVASVTRRFDTGSFKFRRKVVRYVGRWIVENGIMAHLARNVFPSEDVYSLAYEHLATWPDETLRKIGSWLGMTYSPDATRTFLDCENHGVSGGYIRWEDRDTNIRLDERWKRELPQAYARAISLVTRPFANFCGYRREID